MPPRALARARDVQESGHGLPIVLEASDAERVGDRVFHAIGEP